MPPLKAKPEPQYSPVNTCSRSAANFPPPAAPCNDRHDAAHFQADTAERAAAAAAGLEPEGSAPEQKHWGRILAALALDDRQLHYLLLLRERHLDRLQSLAAARQAVSLQVCGQ